MLRSFEESGATAPRDSQTLSARRRNNRLALFARLLHRPGLRRRSIDMASRRLFRAGRPQPALLHAHVPLDQPFETLPIGVAPIVLGSTKRSAFSVSESFFDPKLITGQELLHLAEHPAAR